MRSSKLTVPASPSGCERQAFATAEAITIEGVRVPFLSLEKLIESKATYREQDRADLVRLRDLLELKRQRGDAAN